MAVANPNRKWQPAEPVRFDENPRIVTVTEFVQERAEEISQLFAAINNSELPTGEVCQGPRTFIQRLPRHMRRRAMSHNIRRLPRKMRYMAEATIAESNHRKKPPSRRRRRRPTRLLSIYLRRQRKVKWLGTHIWHSKRFRIADHFGWRLPETSYQRGYRAHVRDMVRHCVIQDISFFSCFELSGPKNELVQRLNRLCRPEVSQTFSNKLVSSGKTEGSITLYQPDAYPYQCIGPVRCIFQPEENKSNRRTLLIWTHPLLAQHVLDNIVSVCQLSKNDSIEEPDVDEKTAAMDALTKASLHRLANPVTYTSTHSKITMRLLDDHFVRFRLLGPKSSSVLASVLHQPAAKELNEYSGVLDEKLYEAQWKLWNDHLASAMPGQLLPGSITALTVGDPRLRVQHKKTLPAAKMHFSGIKDSDLVSPVSGIWSSEWRRQTLNRKATEAVLNKERERRVLSVAKDGDGAETLDSAIPALLIQQKPDSHHGVLGLGAGWDLIVPAGWSLPFWFALQYATARAMGVDFQRRIATLLCDWSSSGKGYPYFWPDTNSGRNWGLEEERRVKEQTEKRPPNQRVNFTKLNIKYPFSFPWTELINGWSSADAEDSMFVLRNRVVLNQLKNLFEKATDKSVTSALNNLCVKYSRALVPVRLTGLGTGVPKSRAIICLPIHEDLVVIRERKTFDDIERSPKSSKIAAPEAATAKREAGDGEFLSLATKNGDIEIQLDSLFVDPKQLRLEHRMQKNKEKKRRRARAKTAESEGNAPLKPDETTSNISANIVDSCRRRVMGLVVDGDYSHVKGHGEAFGFCSLHALNALKALVGTDGLCYVLYRNTRSNFYRAAKLTILMP